MALCTTLIQHISGSTASRDKPSEVNDPVACRATYGVADRATWGLAPKSETAKTMDYGLKRMPAFSCPFCAQSLAGSSLIAHYRAYFSEAYADLKAAIVATGQGVGKIHGGDSLAAFERAVLVATQAHEFWSAFATLPPVAIETLAMAQAWTAAREGVLTALRAKHLAPWKRARCLPPS